MPTRSASAFINPKYGFKRNRKTLTTEVAEHKEVKMANNLIPERWGKAIPFFFPPGTEKFLTL